MTIPIAVYVQLILLMMSSKPARNMCRLTIEINYYKIVHLVGLCHTEDHYVAHIRSSLALTEFPFTDW